MRLILFGVFSFGKMWKNMEKQRFSGRLWPDWGNATWAAMAGCAVHSHANFLFPHYEVMKFGGHRKGGGGEGGGGSKSKHPPGCTPECYVSFCALC